MSRRLKGAKNERGRQITKNRHRVNHIKLNKMYDDCREGQRASDALNMTIKLLPPLTG